LVNGVTLGDSHGHEPRALAAAARGYYHGWTYQLVLVPSLALRACVFASRSDASEMNQNQPASSSDSTSATVHEPVRTPIDPRALSAALAAIATDSQRQSETYLRDTVVPHGGE